MSFGFDAKSTGSGTGNPLTVAHTCAAGAKILFVAVYTQESGSTYRAGGVPTYNSVSMQDSGEGAWYMYSAAEYRQIVEVFFLINPSTGSSYNVSVPNTNGQQLYVTVASYTASGAVSKHASNSLRATTANPAGTFSATVANGLALGACAHDRVNLGSYTPGANYTEIYSADVGADTYFDEYDLDWGSSGTITVDWVNTADDHALIIIGFEEAVAGGDSTPYLTNLKKQRQQHLLVR